jgi:hypothetical protein
MRWQSAAATPLCEESTVPTHPKAPSPLRSAGATKERGCVGDQPQHNAFLMRGIAEALPLRLAFSAAALPDKKVLFPARPSF